MTAPNLLALTQVYGRSTATNISTAVTVSPGNSLIAIDKNSALYLEEGDSLRCFSDQTDLMHVVVSYEISQ